MSRRQKDPLRPLTPAERTTLEQTARAQRERADRVVRAKALLAVASGATYTAAATVAGRRSGDGVAQLVARFNRHGLAALDRRQGGGAPRQYGPVERARILAEFRRPPGREPSSAPCAEPRMGCPRSASRSSSRRCGKPDTPSNRAGRGATPAAPSASARMGRYAPSPTPSPPPKRADRACLSAGRSLGPARLVPG